MIVLPANVHTEIVYFFIIWVSIHLNLFLSNSSVSIVLFLHLAMAIGTDHKELNAWILHGNNKH